MAINKVLNLSEPQFLKLSYHHCQDPSCLCLRALGCHLFAHMDLGHPCLLWGTLLPSGPEGRHAAWRVQEGWCENGGDHQPLPQAPGQTGCSGVRGMCRAGAGWEAALTLKIHHFCIIEVLEFQRWLTTVERVAFFFWAKGAHLLNTFYLLGLCTLIASFTKQIFVF